MRDREVLAREYSPKRAGGKLEQGEKRRKTRISLTQSVIFHPMQKTRNLCAAYLARQARLDSRQFHSQQPSDATTSAKKSRPGSIEPACFIDFNSGSTKNYATLRRRRSATAPIANADKPNPVGSGTGVPPTVTSSPSSPN